MQRFRWKSDSKRGLSAARQGQDQFLVTSFSGRSPTSPALSSPSTIQYSLQPQLYPSPLPSSQNSPRTLGELPTVGVLSSLQPNDFRASVLISEFSQQFPVLRPGAQINIDDLKVRLADQRARGSENHITEEEEDMILDALRFRSRGSKETLSTDDKSLSSSTNLTASPSSGRSKRYSNNLSWSMRLRDHKYMKGMSGRSRANLTSSMQNTSSVIPTESSAVAGTIDSATESSSLSSLRPMTSEETASSIALSSQTGSPPSQQEAESSTGSCVSYIQGSGYGAEESSEALASSVGVSTATSIEYKLKTMDTAALKRASLALQAVFKELEDETEDEIVLPRSRTPHSVMNDSSDPAIDDFGAGPIRPSSHQKESASNSSTEPGVAVAVSTTDKQLSSRSEERRASPLPSRTLPGYIPGMNRPMTPRDFDLDDRSHSITPRATSPVMNVFHPDSLSASSVSGSRSGSGLGRKESISTATVRHSPRPSTPSPLFLRRTSSASSRQTPEVQEGIRRSGSGGNQTIEFESPLNSSLLSRRRPISPLSNVVASVSSSGNVAVVGNGTSSRSCTPSNVIMQPNLSGSTGTTRSMHARSDSWTSDASGLDIVVANGATNRMQSNVQSLPLPGSSSEHNTCNSIGTVTLPSDRGQVIFNGTINRNNDNRISDVFLSNRPQRSPTPTQNAPRSPSSPAFGFINGGSRRSSRQTATSPWGYAGTSYNPPMLNLFGNNSRTSVGSTGSSYHSWEGDKDDREWYDQILSGEDSQPVWHDLSIRKTDTPFSEDQAEEMFKKNFGLTVADVTMIQEKLVTFAGTKGDVARKRRPSTSQSNYVTPGRVSQSTHNDSVPVPLTPSMQVSSPAPQAVQSAVSSSDPMIIPSLTSEQYNQKASALLDSVVSDIQAKHPLPPPLDTSSATVQRTTSSEPSPGTKRNHSLADVLFGSHDTDLQLDESEPALDSPVMDTLIESNQNPVVDDSLVSMQTDLQTESRNATTLATPSSANSAQSPLQLSQNVSSAHVPMSPKDKNEAEFLREFQAKIAQADATIKNTSRTNLPGEGLSHSPSVSRKRINTSKISSPQLLSHSNPASLETLQIIPSRSPTLSISNPGNFSIGSRFKKFRGTLRAKNTLPFKNEVPSPSSAAPSSPTPPSVKTPSSSRTANHDLTKFGTPEASVVANMTETGRSKASFPSSPALGGPGLKNFISRFRGKQRTAESSPAPGKRLSSRLPAQPPPLIPRHQDTLNARTPIATEPGFNPSLKLENASVSSLAPVELSSSAHTASPSTGSRQSVMIQQLFDAASNLGLDQNALSDLLMHSGSITSRSARLAKANTPKSRSVSRQGHRNEVPAALEQSNSGDTSQLTIQPPDPTGSRPSQPTPDSGSTRSLVFRPLEQARRARENRGDRAASTVVRRTIVLPDSVKGIKTDAQSLHRANSGKRRRGSMNSGSLKDRAPTPPPPRSPVCQRFSNDGSPPVPMLPYSLNSDVYLNSPATRPNMNSVYGPSMYEMYANEGRMPGALSMDPHTTESTSEPSGSGPALEFIEYANGDTIWSIVSGLRSEEDEEESIYNGRTSFSSEYSTGTQGDREWENVQVSVKEQARSNSRGSYSSSALKNRKQIAQSKSRPETKVFYSTSTQIGQLIENLSQGMDAGTFNFAPSPTRHGHSAQSSLSTNDISMEDRLELLLGSLTRSS